MTSTCDSCGSEEARLYRVHRRYVTPEAWDTPGVDRVLDEVESWCFACCTSYPNVFADEVGEKDTVDEVGERDTADEVGERDTADEVGERDTADEVGEADTADEAGDTGSAADVTGS